MPKDNKNNKLYTREFKESVLKRIETSNGSIAKCLMN